jgi:LuxR family transcriptional regulator, maltose regulon positive regulatory protein
VCAVAQPGTATSQVDAGSRQGVVARRNLFGLLSAARRVTVVSAPAGSGKSVLLRSWIAEAGLVERTGWVSVGRGERDPQAFWLAVLDSLRGTRAGSELVRELTAAPGLAAGTIVERLTEDLSSLEAQLWLVIDDLHELEADDAIERLELFLRRAPAELRFVLLTRRDPRLGLHRLRLEGELTEIRGEDLLFSLEESRELLEASGVRLSEEALGSLVETTEGWAAGLRLAALSVTRNADPERFAADFSGSERTVAEYLVAEVLDRMPAEFGELLLRTSVLERVNGPLADLLTGGSGGERMLEELERANAFVVSLDPERSWFRYHHLFGDLLQLELRRTAPDEVPALHRRAAGWFARCGRPVEAVRHAQAGEDWDLAVRVLSDHWLGLWLDGRSATAHELLTAFPSEAVVADADLATLAVADELVCGSLEQAERRLVLAMRLSQSVTDERRGRLQRRLSTLRLRLGRQRGDLAAVVEESGRLLGSEESLDAARGGVDEERRAVWLLNLGTAELWTSRLQDAERHLEQALALARRTGRPYLAVGCLANRAVLEAFGSLPAALEAGTQAVELAAEHGWTEEAVVGVAYAVLGLIGVGQGRLDEARRWLDRAQRALTAELDPTGASLLQRTRGMLELAGGRDEQALVALRAALRLDRRLATPHAFAAQTRVLMARALLRLRQTEAAEQVLADLDDELGESSETLVVTAMVALARDDPEAATGALRRVVDGSVGVVHPEHLLEALLLEAIARDALGDPGATGRALERALDLAEPDGLLLPFLLFPASALLERHSRLGTSHAALISEILNLLSGRVPAARPDELGPLQDPLSASELRVLRYLPTNLQAPEIAGELFVSVNTIRTHMRHVYSKLDVHTRAEAVERARALGLLAPGGRSR